MKRTAAILAFTVLALLAVPAEERAVREIAKDVFFWQGDHLQRKPANCTWVVFRDYILVIDANFPWGAREILPEIRKTSNKPIRYLFNTHYHSDHTFGNSVFADAGATVVCSEQCAAELEEKGRPQWKRFSGTKERNLENARLEAPSIRFSERMVFDDGEHRVELIHAGPAHTKGDSVALLPREKILVTGDLCVNWTWGNYIGDPDANHEAWTRVLDRLAGWDVQTVLPGHGEPGTVTTLRKQRAYLADILDQVRTGVRAGKSADQLAREIDLSKHGHFAANPKTNESGIRAVHRKVAGVP